MREVYKFIAWVLVALGLVAGFLKWQYVDVVTVAHDGMAPTIVLGDRVLLWRNAHIDRNDVVLCRHPRDANRWVMGRVILMPGEGMQVDRQQLIRGRYRITTDYRGVISFAAMNNRAQGYRWGFEQVSDNDFHMFMERENSPPRMNPVRVSNGLYLLGDNRAFGGEDSRSFGAVPPANCRGQVFMRLSAAERLPPEIKHKMLDLL
jgi:signal peptidase I